VIKLSIRSPVQTSNLDWLCPGTGGVPQDFDSHLTVIAAKDSQFKIINGIQILPLHTFRLTILAQKRWITYDMINGAFHIRCATINIGLSLPK
jgi:hypothetical protein